MSRKIKLVVDTSVMVKWINSQDEKYLDQADAIAQDWKTGKVKIIAPELAKYEIGNVLKKKSLDLPTAKASLATIYASPVDFVKQSESDAMRSMEIAIKSETTFYDAVFMALAEKTGAILVTDNPEHQEKFSGIKVVSLKDYK